ncbi:gamma-glutamyl-gamma-aminobutyrate hydrolase family protein [Herbiconiux sp. P15]|uniref:gamma-glutamyl-gamma-aminobutyrate hydrolase family protein n=1 Tax=Herbiconiux liukaitaii TaxID=3342799 RepID=UPI0035B772E1
MTSGARLSVVVATRDRPLAPEYAAYSKLLLARAVADSEAVGWQVDVVSAAEEGALGTLRRTERSAAIVVLGGEDIAPEYYGAARGYAREGAHLERADEAQLALVRRAAERATPLVGVCRGHQIINVALGGTLLQDLGDSSSHRNEGVPVHRVMSTHDVALASESRLAARFGSALSTRSAHHQAIDRLGRGLRIAATAEDGLIEAVEHRELPIVGVQWHPEDVRAERGQFAGILSSVTRTAALAA